MKIILERIILMMKKGDSLLNIDSSEKLKIGLGWFEKRVMCFA